MASHGLLRSLIKCVQNIELAIAEFSKAIFLVDDDPLFYEMRGEAYLLLTDYKTAVSNFKRALQVTTFQSSIPPSFAENRDHPPRAIPISRSTA